MIKQKLTVSNILSWLASTGITLVAALFVAMRWYGDYKLTNKAVADTLAIVYKNTTETKKEMSAFKAFQDNTNTRLNVVEGNQEALDGSYVRTLERQINSKDELLKYKDEKIKALNEALKKNDCRTGMIQ